MNRVNWHSPAALDWLKIILKERFGHMFNLEPQEDGLSIVMALPGYMRFITLRLEGATFIRADSEMHCTNWDATNDGWSTAMPGTLPAPGFHQLQAPLITKNSNGWHCGYDILGFIYWMLSRQEEVGRTDLDVHGRFPAIASHAYRFGYLERPIVDEWLYILGQIINRTWPEINLKTHSFHIKISHDVDQPSLYAFKSWGQIVRMMGGHLLKRLDTKAFFQAPYIKLVSRSKIHPLDPFNTFEWIMDHSERNGLSSAFYFLCGHTDPHDADYRLEDPRITHLMKRIHERGHEIGLHPSYGSFNKPEMIRDEGIRLRRICGVEGIKQDEWGGRMHYLRWEHPKTLRAWVKAGFNYDSTMGYADLPGFRCGTCFEYPAFDPVAKEVIKFRLRPLMLMESTLIETPYCGLGAGEEATEIALKIKQKCKKVNGTFAILWHNSSFTLMNQQKMYLKLLESDR